MTISANQNCSTIHKPIIPWDRVTHKEWDCKDDLKLLKYDNFKFIVAGNHECKETDRMNSV